MKLISRQRCVSRSGYTLVEMLVALTASLILFGVVMTIFGVLGEAVSKSRRVGTLDAELCAISTTLLQDLAGVTAVRNAAGLVTNPDSGSVTGYFEIVEGPSFDAVTVTDAEALIDKSLSDPHNPATGSDDRIVGDIDDMLFFTTQSVNVEPFIGKFLNTTQTSREAEVAYFCRRMPDTSNPQLYTLHRRQLLIVAGSPLAQFDEFGRYRTYTNWADFYSKFDISARREVLDGADIAVLNTANDLQRRRNRTGHDNGSADSVYPIPADAPLPLLGVREGEDVIARNVLSFDVRLLDLSAMERTSAAFPVGLIPSDPGYWSSGVVDVSPQSPVYCDLGYGAFSDLYSELYATPLADPAASQFSRWSEIGAPESNLIGDAKQPIGRTYDTWTTFYQSNGIDDGLAGDADEEPPYPANLRAIQVTIRLYDAQSKTIRQRTIVHSFAD
jgi:prepilin-type N-terminal cleavage/methylation domain-containing protein